MFKIATTNTNALLITALKILEYFWNFDGG
jgi:hypothetical protein